MILDKIRMAFESCGLFLAAAVFAVVGLLVAFLAALIDSLRQR